MDLMDFYERQQQDLERYKSLRDKVWQQVSDDNEKLAASFGGKELLNTDAKKLFDSRISSFNAEWSMDGGSRYKDLTEQHEKQLRQITGDKSKSDSSARKDVEPRKEKSDATTKDKFRNQSESMTDKDQRQDNVKSEDRERQALKQKIAQQQAAIKARKMQQKRGR